MSEAADVLRRALVEIRSLKERLAATERAAFAGNEPIAIIGIGCRFPGGADTPDAFWRLLHEGRDTIGPQPPGRWTDAAPPRPGGYLDDIEGFDTRFFAIAPREAAAMDPQHRLLLEVAWHALQHAAIDPPQLAGSRTGLFLGLATHDYLRNLPDDALDRHYGTGSSPAAAAGRVAYTLDLRGPCVTLDTACSSSLVAVHYAMRALRDRDCDTALAAGVSLMLGPALTRSFEASGMLAADSRCKSFDAAADGYVRGEGCGVVVLRRLADAQRDGDPIIAVLRGSAINQDGRSAGLTAPNGPAQTALILDALRNAGLEPGAIDCIEAHGTGTRLGDPIEWHALAAAFAGRDRPLFLGSAKSNIGHTEAAAGIAGVIKAALMLQHDTIAPSLHYTTRNPEITAGTAGLDVVTAPRRGVRRVGVSAFGISGTNAHAVLEAAPARDPAHSLRTPLPATQFQRERFPLPGATPPDRLIAPDDPLLDGCAGLAHVGTLLHLLDAPAGLGAIAFPAPLHIATPRPIRTRRDGATFVLESRPPAAETWTTHLRAEPAAPAPPPQPAPPIGAPSTPATDLYRRIAAQGFPYGPAARRLTGIAVDGLAADGTLSAASTASSMEPGLVEAAAQLAYALLPPGAPPVMLAGADSVFRAPGQPSRAWMRLSAPPGPDGLRGAFGLCDAEGRALLHIAGARFVPLPDHTRAWSRLVTWRPAASPTATAAPAEPWIATQQPAATLCADLLRHLQNRTAPLLIVTHGAQSTGQEAAPPALDQAALWGFALAVIAERPALRCRLLDLDPDRAVGSQDDVIRREAACCDEPAIAWRNGRRLARRFGPLPPRPAAPSLATLAGPGELRWDAADTAPPPPGCVRIAVVAAGLTFRDRLLFTGLAPARLAPPGLAPAGSTLGADCAGIVTAVGPGVAAPRVGDPVIALAAGSIADSVVVPVERVAPAPCRDLVASATMPVPYLTALAALPPLGPHDRVLVHQAGSATGLAAMAVARRAGASVVATASLPRHRWFGPERLLDSRAPDSWGDTLDGVTVAFGAFDTDLAARLAHARVVNLDKRAAGHFDLDQVPPASLRALFAELATFPPLPRHLVPRTDLAEALADPAPTRVGRAVVLLRDAPPATIEAGATYLVTGAAGALGAMVAGWLAAAGAHLCLVDIARCEAAPPHRAIQADAGDAAAMAALLASIPNLRGIFHCAALTDDDTLDLQTPERIAAVLRAKTGGARVLDTLTRTHGAPALDHFVLFSSVVSLLPSARQAAYAAANAVLDQIARARQQRGLPGLSLNWGAWAAGIGSQMGARAAETWRRFGVTPILPAAGLRALPSLLASPEPQRIVADMDWDAYANASRSDDRTPPVTRPSGPVTVSRLQAILAPILGIADPSSIDEDTPLTAFGLDSLAAVDFARAVSRSLGRPIAPDFAYNQPTLRQAAAALAPRAPGRQPQTHAFTLLAPRWEPREASLHATTAWTIEGHGDTAAALRATLDAGHGNLLDLSALDAPGDDAPSFFARLFPRLQDQLRREPPGRIVLAAPAGSPMAGALAGLATALAVEQPAWTIRALRLDPGIAPDRIARELGADDPQVWLRADSRLASHLRPAVASGPFRADPHATYLITGGTGGIGARVAAHLVACGARHLALLGRHPVMPPGLDAAHVTLYAASVDNVAAMTALFADLAARPAPLRGIVHAAGVTADGRFATGDLATLQRAFPAKAAGAQLLHRLSAPLPLSHFVLFSSTTARFGLAGTAGYAAANGYLDGLAETRHAAGLPAQSIGWCAWQGVGMAADPMSWAQDRVPALPPEAALAALDAALCSGEPNLVVMEPGWTQATASPALAAAGE